MARLTPITATPSIVSQAPFEQAEQAGDEFASGPGTQLAVQNAAAALIALTVVGVRVSNQGFLRDIVFTIANDSIVYVLGEFPLDRVGGLVQLTYTGDVTGGSGFTVSPVNFANYHGVELVAVP